MHSRNMYLGLQELHMQGVYCGWMNQESVVITNSGEVKLTRLSGQGNTANDIKELRILMMIHTHSHLLDLGQDNQARICAVMTGKVFTLVIDADTGCASISDLSTSLLFISVFDVEMLQLTDQIPRPPHVPPNTCQLLKDLFDLVYCKLDLYFLVFVASFHNERFSYAVVLPAISLPLIGPSRYTQPGGLISAANVMEKGVWEGTAGTLVL
ncbi:hypothetical protein RJT34_18765 [Clitoria ternatea]|uniref:Uncharacterized protein n=1 Tax=Clitoria ternatea TaxID=43366 RepID=A0AAN9JBT4_CLITE